MMIIDIYKFAYIPAMIASFAMLVMLVATIVWSLFVFTDLPDVYTGNFGLWQTSTQAWIYGIISLMMICCVTSLLGVAHGRSALIHA